MFQAVADTHAALWYLYGDDRLSSLVKRIMDDAAGKGDGIAIPSISLAEVVYLVEKGRVPADAFELLSKALFARDHAFTEFPLTAAVVAAMRWVSREDVPDMPDRIVAATGVYLGVPILSRDGKIRAAGLQTIW